MGGGRWTEATGQPRPPDPGDVPPRMGLLPWTDTSNREAIMRLLEWLIDLVMWARLRVVASEDSKGEQIEMATTKLVSDIDRRKAVERKLTW